MHGRDDVEADDGGGFMCGRRAYARARKLVGELCVRDADMHFKFAKSRAPLGSYKLRLRQPR